MLTRPVLLYDGNCGFCLGWVVRIRRWDRQGALELIAAGSRGMHPELLQLSDQALHEAMHLILPGGAVYAGGRAIPEILRLLPGGWVVAWVFRLPGVRWATDRAYRWVAQRRHRLGCGVKSEKREGRSEK